MSAPILHSNLPRAFDELLSSLLILLSWGAHKAYESVSSHPAPKRVFSSHLIVKTLGLMVGAPLRKVGPQRHKVGPPHIEVGPLKLEVGPHG